MESRPNMPHRDFVPATTRVSWRRRLTLSLLLGIVAIVVWRFSAVMLRRAAARKLEESGWTIIYEQTANPSPLVDKITARLGQPGQFVAGLLGRDPDIVEVRISDRETSADRQVELSTLSRLPFLQRLFLQREDLSPSDVESIGAIGSLTELNIASDVLTDQSLSALAGLSHLKHLTITSQRVSDEGLSHLTTITTLQSLDLQSTRAGGSGVQAFSRLEHLSLGPYTDGDDLASVGQLPRLKELVLTDSRIGDDGFRELQSLESLEMLYLTGPNSVTDEGLAILGEFDRLASLTLQGQQYTFAGLDPLSQSAVLEYLELRGRGLDDAGLDSFVPPPSLKEMRLHNTSISEEGFDRFESRYPEVDLWR